MKKTHITLAAVAALATAVAVAPTAQADVQAKLDNIKGVVKISVEAQLNKNLADASAQSATAKANLTTAEATVKTKKETLATAQKAEQEGVKQIDEATATALKVEEKKVADAKAVVTATEKLIAAEKEKIVAAQAKIKELNLVGGLTGKAAEIATEEATIAAAEAQIVTLNTQLEADTQAVTDAEEALVTWKEERAKSDAAAKKVFTDATAKAQKALTAAETEVSEWKVVVETLNKEVEAAKLELIKNGLTDAQIAQIIADAQAQVKVDTVATSVYRLYNSGLKVHLYTTDVNEYNVLAARGWSQEGVAFKSAKEGTPVYRLYNEGLKVHLYTTDANEYEVLGGRGWRKEGVAFNSVKEGTPVYRLYNEGLKKHLYTTDANENEVLATRGWKKEGVAFYSAK
ncbi:TPA: hypothetical protein U1344_000735 [Streptococcus suis]|nr:hypothetical protein [Streptococcus suis]HEM5162392.1 hypothetical protein [Streptococcus suis]HEM5206515.1 hypothetical protein [Streptococcus suis]HEM5227241.1 hypothetical protein [Streptococcus suis]HEM5237682.1 hypothetical protein [Streptococcus suis]